MCVYQPYTPRERHPLFFRYPLVVPHPSQVVGSLQRQRLPPQPRSCLIAPSPSQSQRQGLPRPGEKIRRIDTATVGSQQLQRKYLMTP